MLKPRLSQPVQTINAGVPAYGPDQVSLVMEDEIDTVRPDLVIVAIAVYNDYGDIIRDKLYRLDERGQLIAGHPELDAGLKRYFESARKEDAKFQVTRLLESSLTFVRPSLLIGGVKHLVHPRQARSRTVRPDSSKQIVDGWLLVRQEEYQSYLAQDNFVHNLLDDTYDADVSLTPRSQSSQLKILLMDRVMEHIYSIASTRSIPLIFLIVPAPIDLEDNWGISIDPAVFPEYRRSRLTDVIEEIAKKHQWYYLNLFEPFRTHRAGKLHFGIPDGHWTDAGQRLVATLLSDYIVQNNVLRPAPGQ
jgi:hypothetical protein